MPNIKCQTEVEVDIDFEVFCGTCNNGLCNNTETRLSRTRSHPQIVVEVCQDCISEKDEEIENLKNEIEELKEEIIRLNNKIDEYEEQKDNETNQE